VPRWRAQSYIHLFIPHCIMERHFSAPHWCFYQTADDRESPSLHSVPPLTEWASGWILWRGGHLAHAHWFGFSFEVGDDRDAARRGASQTQLRQLNYFFGFSNEHKNPLLYAKISPPPIKPFSFKLGGGIQYLIWESVGKQFYVNWHGEAVFQCCSGGWS